MGITYGRNCRMRSVSCMHRSSSLVSGKGDFNLILKVRYPAISKVIIISFRLILIIVMNSNGYDTGSCRKGC